jgi:hypothetical protein
MPETRAIEMNLHVVLPGNTSQLRKLIDTVHGAAFGRLTDAESNRRHSRGALMIACFQQSAQLPRINATGEPLYAQQTRAIAEELDRSRFARQNMSVRVAHIPELTGTT